MPPESAQRFSPSIPPMRTQGILAIGAELIRLAHTESQPQGFYMTTKLHIGNMPRTSTNTDIEGLFRPFGLVASVVFTKDPLTGINTGCGTVEMDNDVDAQSAINRLNFSQYGGRTIGVSRLRDGVGRSI